MQIFMFAASLRKESFNKKLIRQAAALIESSGGGGHSIDLCEFNEFEMPVYNADLETSSGIPMGVKKLGEKIAAAEALIISTPEYNGSIPGPLKNAIDWVSRIRPVPWAGKPLLLLGASPGALGAVRSLWHTRVPFEVLGVFVYPEMFGLAGAGDAFAADGKLKDGKQQERLASLLQKYLSHLEGAGRKLTPQ